MKFAEAEASGPKVTELSSRVEDRICTLRWRWPDGVQAVLIHKESADGGMPSASRGLPPAGMKLYTREEYKANNGYHDRLDDIGLVSYTIYIRLTRDGEILLLRQPDGGNTIVVSAGKAWIYYSTVHKKGWFQKTKTVHMTITAESPVPRDALCYVKKRGGYPASKDDGVRFSFVEDFAAGRNVLPPIEVGPEDYVRVFFTDGPKYAQVYELVPE